MRWREMRCDEMRCGQTTRESVNIHGWTKARIHELLKRLRGRHMDRQRASARTRPSAWHREVERDTMPPQCLGLACRRCSEYEDLCVCCFLSPPERAREPPVADQSTVSPQKRRSIISTAMQNRGGASAAAASLQNLVAVSAESPPVSRRVDVAARSLLCVGVFPLLLALALAPKEESLPSWALPMRMPRLQRRPVRPLLHPASRAGQLLGTEFHGRVGRNCRCPCGERRYWRATTATATIVDKLTSYGTPPSSCPTAHLHTSAELDGQEPTWPLCRPCRRMRCGRHSPCPPGSGE